MPKTCFRREDIRKLEYQQLIRPVLAMDEAGAHDVARRLKQHLTAVMSFAIENGIIKSNPPAGIKPRFTVVKTRHHPALPESRIQELLLRISNYNSEKKRALTRMAVELTLLTFLRSSEVRFARWNEVDFKRCVWEIPGTRTPVSGVKNSHRGMKMRTPHIVPLSRQAMFLLQEIQKLSGNELWIFPGDHNPLKPMSENTINKSLRVMGYDTQVEVCGHGFRTMACSSLIESGLWSRDAVERQMSHMERNSVRAAYYIHKAGHLDERKLMLQWWADFLDENREKAVSPFDFAKYFSGKS